MSEFTLALGLVAPYYNLALVTIVVILFIKLLKIPAQPKQLLPWKVLFAAVVLYIIEEILTVLRGVNIVTIPVHINGFFELAIITLFIYTILKQKEISKI